MPVIGRPLVALNAPFVQPMSPPVRSFLRRGALLPITGACAACPGCAIVCAR
jgi:hypothetical protein